MISDSFFETSLWALYNILGIGIGGGGGGGGGESGAGCGSEEVPVQKLKYCQE